MKPANQSDALSNIYRTRRRVIFERCNERREREDSKWLLTQDVLVPHQDGLVDLCLSGPTGLIGGEEDFDGHLLSPPPAHPHLPVATLPDLLHHLDLLGDRPLHLGHKHAGG